MTPYPALSKDKRINIRVSSRDLEDIQMRAAEEGMPYQTLIASVLHMFVRDRLIETMPGQLLSQPVAIKNSGPVNSQPPESIKEDTQ